MRAVRHHGATASVVFYDDNGTPTDAGTVSVKIVRANGETLAEGTATHKGVGTGEYTFPIDPQANLDLLTLHWSGTINSIAITEVTHVEIIGAHLFSIADVQSDESLASATTEEIVRARDEVTDEFEKITRLSFVPRYRKTLVSGTGHGVLLLNDFHVTKVHKAGDVDPALVTPTHDGVLLTSGGWPHGFRNIEVEYEYGLERVPADVRRAALRRVRSRLHEDTSGLPDRATSYDAPEGGSYRLATAGQGKWQTGIPDVDAVLFRYAMPVGV